MRRRTLLKRAGSVGVASALTGFASNGPEPLRIGFFVSDDVRAAEPINSASRAVERHLSPLTRRPLSVGPEGVVSVEHADTIEEVAEWWANEASVCDIDVLCLGPCDYEHHGYARYGSPHCVLTHTYALDREWGEWLTCHEIAHVLGARHHHGNGTIMEQRYEDVERVEYSRQTRRRLRRAL